MIGVNLPRFLPGIEFRQAKNILGMVFYDQTPASVREHA